MVSERVAGPAVKAAERKLEDSLRPPTLGEFVGQEQVKKNLRVFLDAAKKRNEPIEHVLLSGPPGLGKTTLAHIIAREVGVNLVVTSGPAIEKQGDLAAMLTNLKERDILFVDEIHRLNRSIEEVLYPAMEDYALDLVVGKGPGARSLRLDLPRFTIIGATTRVGMLSAPLRDRFGANYRLNFYTPEDIATIVQRSAKILRVAIEPAAVQRLSHRARLTPRIANRLLKRVRDFADVAGEGSITAAVADAALDQLGVDTLGLDELDRAFLSAVVERFSGGPVGLNAVAAAVGEDEASLLDVVEPYLVQAGLIDRTPRGRVATPQAFTHLGVATPDKQGALPLR
ncbi:MAG: Holliday junction branch migration DNA helicase RuvB [Candidatus Andersenbacteria bacterium]